jgi:hypothetical protein
MVTITSRPLIANPTATDQSTRIVISWFNPNRLLEDRRSGSIQDDPEFQSIAATQFEIYGAGLPSYPGRIPAAEHGHCGGAMTATPDSLPGHRTILT